MTDKILEAIRIFIENNTVDKQSLTNYVLIISAIGIFSIIINLVIQLLLRRTESNESIRKIRNERRLDSTEKLYTHLCGLMLSLFDSTVFSGDGCSEFNRKISKTRQWLEVNNLRMDKRIEKKAVEVLDYLTLVISDPSKRNLSTEIQLKKAVRHLYEIL